MVYSIASLLFNSHFSCPSAGGSLHPPTPFYCSTVIINLLLGLRKFCIHFAKIIGLTSLLKKKKSCLVQTLCGNVKILKLGLKQKKPQDLKLLVSLSETGNV